MIKVKPNKVSLKIKIGILLCILFIISALFFFHQKSKQLPTLWVDTIPLQVEIADTPEALQKGLMYRKNLPDNQGMLFVFEKTDYQAFWMKNTYIPLAIAFISAEGQIVQIDSMQPLDTVSSHISKMPVKYAIEVNQNWFNDHKITIGNGVRGLP